jgi:hypothetical protein
VLSVVKISGRRDAQLSFCHRLRNETASNGGRFPTSIGGEHARVVRLLCVIDE